LDEWVAIVAFDDPEAIKPAIESITPHILSEIIIQSSTLWFAVPYISTKSHLSHTELFSSSIIDEVIAR
jgi:hypothetical protein